MLGRTSLVATSIFSIVLMTACAAPTGDSGEGQSVAATDPLLKIPRPIPREYFLPYVYNAYVNDVGCTPVATSRGTWASAPTFYKVNAFCTYHWTGTGTPTDAELKANLGARGVDPGLVYADFTCGADGACTRPRTATEDLRDKGGSRYQCSKCIPAAVSGKDLEIVLPPELVTLGLSPLSVVIDGSLFEIEQPGSAAAFTVPFILPTGWRAPRAAAVVGPSGATTCPDCM